MSSILGSPVLLVGGGGVGAAVDSYNINKAYFTSFNTCVIGAIFNKVPPTGFYGVEATREWVGKYFDRFLPGDAAYGFLAQQGEGEGTDNEEVQRALLRQMQTQLDGRQMLHDLFVAQIRMRDRHCNISVHNPISGTPIIVEANHSGRLRSKRSREEVENSAVMEGATGG